jgi:hypothetical protein
MVTRKLAFEKQEHGSSFTFKLIGCLNFMRPTEVRRFCGVGCSCDTACHNQTRIMFRIGIVCCVLLSATPGGASAESPAERGGYLGNCHTPPMAYTRLKHADL